MKRCAQPKRRECCLGISPRADLTCRTGSGQSRLRGFPRIAAPSGAAFCSRRLPGSATDGARYAAMRSPTARRRFSSARMRRPTCRRTYRCCGPTIRAGRWRLLAARFYPRQPERMVAVTGTSGKTSVAAFARQIFAGGRPRGGERRDPRRRQPAVDAIRQPDDARPGGAAPRPRPAGAARGSCTRRWRRRATVSTSAGSTACGSTAAGFTNLGRDHMDYHPTVEDYLAAKLRLFSASCRPSGTAVVDMDDAHGASIVATARARGQTLLRVGRGGRRTAARRRSTPDGFRQRLTVEAFGKRARHRACRSPALSRRPTRWSPPVSPSAPASRSTPRSRRSRTCRARPAGWNWSAASRTAR